MQQFSAPAPLHVQISDHNLGWLRGGGVAVLFPQVGMLIINPIHIYFARWVLIIQFSLHDGFTISSEPKFITGFLPTVRHYKIPWLFQITLKYFKGNPGISQNFLQQGRCHNFKSKGYKYYCKQSEQKNFGGCTPTWHSGEQQLQRDIRTASCEQCDMP